MGRSSLSAREIAGGTAVAADDVVRDGEARRLAGVYRREGRRYRAGDREGRAAGRGDWGDVDGECRRPVGRGAGGAAGRGPRAVRERAGMEFSEAELVVDGVADLPGAVAAIEARIGTGERPGSGRGVTQWRKFVFTSSRFTVPGTIVLIVARRTPVRRTRR